MRPLAGHRLKFHIIRQNRAPEQFKPLAFRIHSQSITFQATETDGEGGITLLRRF